MAAKDTNISEAEIGKKMGDATLSVGLEIIRSNLLRT